MNISTRFSKTANANSCQKTTSTQSTSSNRPSLLTRWFFICTMIVSALWSTNSMAQLTGTKNVPTDYATLAAAITDLNTVGVGAGGVTITVTAATPQTAPNGTGYYITATGTAANPIVIDGGGNTITAGTNTANGSMDAVFKIIGGDYITIQNCVIVESGSNTVTATGATNTMTEAGILLIHASATDGAQNNTIQNNTITLSSVYPNTIGVFSTSSSTTTNASPGSNTTADATSTAGTNSNNTVKGNTISGAAYGIMFICPPITATIFETGNTIGASGAANTITYGNNTASTAPWNRSSSASAGIMYRNGAGNNISFNSVTSIAALALATTGISISSGSAPTGVTYTSTMSSNTVTITSTITAMTGIDFGHGISTGTMAGSSNTISLTQTAAAAASGALIGIKANYTAATSTINLNGITFTQSQSAAATTSAITGINAAGVAPTVNVQTNTITVKQNAPSGAGSYGSGAITLIEVSSTGATYNVTGNTLNTTGSTVRSTGTLICVRAEGTVTALYNIKSNIVNIDRVAASGTIYFTFQSTSPSNVADTVSSNNISFTSLAGTTISNGISQLGGPSTSSGTKSICNNTISISGTATGIATAIAYGYSANSKCSGNTISLNTNATQMMGINPNTTTGSGATATITGNTLTEVNATTGTGVTFGIYIQSLGTNIVSGNTFTNLSYTGGGAAVATVQALTIAGGVLNNVSNNTFTSLTTSGASPTGAHTMFGMSLQGGTTNYVTNNFVTNISTAATTGAGFACGISVSTGTTTNVISGNKVACISSSSTNAATQVNGIRVTGGTTDSLYNNYIGDLSAPAASNLTAVLGINANSTVAGSNIRVFNNTIYLNASSSGTTFGTTGIFHQASATATVAALDLRNNIVINLSTPGSAGGITSVLMRTPAATLNNYSTNSNRNLYYAGTPGANRAILNDAGAAVYGTSAAGYAFGPVGTTGTFQNFVTASRESLSFTGEAAFTYSTVNSFFQSLTCTDPTYLHVKAGITTQVEGGASAIAGIGTDYDGDTRTSTPDIGADEFVGQSPAPAISQNGAAPTGQCTATSHLISVNVTTPSGTINSPVTITYNNGTLNSNIAMTNTTGNIWEYTIPVASPVNTTVTWSVSATNSLGVTTVFNGASYTDAPLFGKSVTIAGTPTSVCPGASANLTATVSGFASGVKITEITQNYVGTGTNASPPSYLAFNVGSGNELVELTNTGSFSASLNGITIERWYSSTTVAEVIYSMPSGVTLTPGQTAVLAYGAGTNDLVNKLFYAGTPGFDIRASSDLVGYIIKSGATVLDAVGVSGYSFPVASGVVAGDWSGSIPSMSGLAGSRLSGADNNTASTWTVAGASNIINFGVINSGIPAPTAYTTTWSTVPSSAFTASGLTANTGALNTATTFTFTLTDPASGCSITPATDVTISVNTLPTAPTASNSTQCGDKVPTASVSGTIGATFKWYAASSGGTALQSSTSTTYTTSVSTTTTFYVTEVGPGGCESTPRTPVTVTVTNPDLVTASALPTSVCVNQSSVLSVAVTTVNNSPANTYNYTWSVLANAGTAGLPGTLTGSSITVTPSAALTYTYRVTANDPVSGCQTTSDVPVVVKALPVIDSIKASPSTVCAGTPSSLSVYASGIGAGPQSSPTYAAPPTVSNPTTDEDLGNITITQGATTILNNSSLRNDLVGTIGTATGIAGDYANYTSFGPYNLTAGGTYNFSLSALQSTTAYSNSMAIYIDYNRDGDFLDAGEKVYAALATTSGAHTETGSFTVPATALGGWMRMRVISNEGLITSPTGAVSYGEFEEYTINMTGVIRQNTTYNYAWNNGAGSTATVSVTPSGTTTYNVLVTDPSTTCASTSSNVTVTVNPAPQAPSATNSTQCGNQIPTASVTSNSGATTPLFKWYSVPGHVLLQGGPTGSAPNTYGTAVNATTTFMVSEVSDLGCEGDSVAVTVTVTPPDVLTVTSSTGTAACVNEIFDFTSSYTPDVNTFNHFVLTASSYAGSGLSGPVTLTINTNGDGTDPYNVQPTAAGVYTYTISADESGSCISVGTVIVTVSPVPSSVTAGSNAASVCTGSTVNLTSTGQTNIYGGNGTLFNAGFETTFPTANWTFINAGSGNAWANSTTAHSGSQAISYTYNSDFAANAWAITPAQSLIGGQTYTLTFWYKVISASFPEKLKVTIGTNNTVAAQTNILWNNNGGSSLTNTTYAQGTMTYTPSTSGTYYFGFNCYSDADEDVLYVDDVVLSGPVAETPTFSWATVPPSAFTSNVQNPTGVTVNATTTYRVTVSNSGGCALTADVTVNAIPLPTAPTGTNSSQCGDGVPTASVSGTTGATFKWYAASSGGTALQSSTSTTYTTSVNTTTTFYVTEVGAGSCESSPRTPVTVTVTTPPPVTITPTGGAGALTFCEGGSVELTASGSGYTSFTWTPGPISGATVTVSPTVTTTYSVLATGGGCSATQTQVVTVNPKPVINSVTASPAIICSGSSTLTATILAPTTFTIGESAAVTTPTSNAGYGMYFSTTGAATINTVDIYPSTAGTLNVTLRNASSTVIDTRTFTIVAGDISTTVLKTLTLNFSVPAGSTGWLLYYDLAINREAGTFSYPYTANGFTLTGNTIDGVNVTGGTRFYFYNWSVTAPGDNSSAYSWLWSTGATTNSTSVTPTTLGANVYTVTATNPATNCVSATGSVTVTKTTATAAATATPATTVSTPVCAGTSVTLNGSTSQGSGLTYAWSGGTGPGATTATTVSTTVAPTTTTTYTLTVTDACSNVNSTTITVYINPLPTATIAEAGPITICAPSTQLLTAQTAAASPSYQWTLNGTNILGATNPTYTVTATGTYRVKVTDGTTTCTSAPSPGVTVTVNPQPAAVTVTPPTATICAGEVQQLTASGGAVTGAIAISENFDNDAPTWTITSAGTSPVVSNFYYQSAPYNDQAGSAKFTNFTTVNGGKFALSNSDAGGLGSTSNSVLTSPVFSLNGFTAASLTFEHGYKVWSSGDATVLLEISTNGGTSWSTLVDYKGTDVGNTTNNTQTTANATVPLTSYLGMTNLKIRYNYVSAWGYYWIIDNVKVSGTQATAITWTPTATLYTNPGATTGYTGGAAVSVYAKPTTTTTYTATATSALGCTNTGTSIITVNPLPTVSYTGLAEAYCTTDADVTLTGNHAPNGTFSITPTPPVGAFIDNANGTATFKPSVAGASGPYSIVYSYTSAGCTATDSHSTTVTVCATTVTVNMKLFLQGYYAGGGTMQPVLNNQGVTAAAATETDSVLVELHDVTDPSIIVNSKMAVLNTDGTLSATMTQAAGTYWVALKHRSSVQTWTAAPIAVTASTPLYDFTGAANMAFGDNQFEVESGIWGMFVGDLNQDEYVDAFDYGGFNDDNLAGVNTVYVATDMNGDGFVDAFDYGQFNDNNLAGVSSQHP